MAREEYHKDLDSILADTARTQEERLLQLGRLVGVVLKEPFATAEPINPTTSYTGAYRGWELKDSAVFDKPDIQARWPYKVLESLREYDYNNEHWPTAYELAFRLQDEKGFFQYLLLSTRKYVCGDPALRQKVDTEVKASLPGRGKDSLPVMVMAQQLAHILVQHVPWLATAGAAGAPLIIGLCFWLVLYISNIGIDAFCDWSGQFQPPYGPPDGPPAKKEM